MNWWPLLSGLMMFLAAVTSLFVIVAAGRSALNWSTNERRAAEDELVFAAALALMSISLAFFAGRGSVMP